MWSHSPNQKNSKNKQSSLKHIKTIGCYLILYEFLWYSMCFTTLFRLFHHIVLLRGAAAEPKRNAMESCGGRFFMDQGSPKNQATTCNDNCKTVLSKWIWHNLMILLSLQFLTLSCPNTKDLWAVPIPTNFGQLSCVLSQAWRPAANPKWGAHAN